MIKRWISSGLLVALLAMSTAWAQQRWLHVRVEENGSTGDRVNINVPLDLVETMLPLIDVDEFHGGKLQIDDHDLEGIDLREIVLALRDSTDTTFVTVNSDDESIRVAKEGDFLIVRIDEDHGRSQERVHVRLPLAVFEALVADDDHELDIAHALRVLSEFDGEDLVRIESEDELVRIWIDSSEDGL